jgi:hypothetical protein
MHEWGRSRSRLLGIGGDKAPGFLSGACQFGVICCLADQVRLNQGPHHRPCALKLARRTLALASSRIATAPLRGIRRGW